MSDGTDRDEELSFLHDQLMGDAEMMKNWKQISIVLQKRADAAKKAYHRDPESRRKVENFLKTSKEFYAFSRLVYLFGKLVENATENLTLAGKLPSSNKKSELN